MLARRRQCGLWSPGGWSTQSVWSLESEVNISGLWPRSWANSILDSTLSIATVAHGLVHHQIMHPLIHTLEDRTEHTRCPLPIQPPFLAFGP